MHTAVSCTCCMASLGIHISSPQVSFLQIFCCHMWIQQNSQHTLSDLTRSVSWLVSQFAILLFSFLSHDVSVRNLPVLFPVPLTHLPLRKSPCSVSYNPDSSPCKQSPRSVSRTPWLISLYANHPVLFPVLHDSSSCTQSPVLFPVPLTHVPVRNLPVLFPVPLTHLLVRNPPVLFPALPDSCPCTQSPHSVSCTPDLSPCTQSPVLFPVLHDSSPCTHSLRSVSCTPDSSPFTQSLRSLSCTPDSCPCTQSPCSVSCTPWLISLYVIPPFCFLYSLTHHPVRNPPFCFLYPWLMSLYAIPRSVFCSPDSSPCTKSPCSSAHSHSPHSIYSVQITKD